MNNKANKGKSKRQNRLLAFLLVLFSVIFVFSASMVVKELVRSKKEKDAFDKMEQEIQQIVQQAEENPVANEKTVEELLLEHYGELKQQNPHFVGWISIADTPLSYPVVHTPEDVEYYLRRAFDGSYAVSGTPFLGEGCDVDSTNVLIYGHRMNNETMFTTLLSYAKKDFWQTHREITFDTVDRLQTYEVVAAFYINIPQPGDAEAFHWYGYGGDISDELLEEYAQQLKAHAYYDTGVEIEHGDKLITLTTCAYNNEEQRFVVVAKLKQ